MRRSVVYVTTITNRGMAPVAPVSMMGTNRTIGDICSFELCFDQGHDSEKLQHVFSFMFELSFLWARSERARNDSLVGLMVPCHVILSAVLSTYQVLTWYTCWDRVKA